MSWVGPLDRDDVPPGLEDDLHSWQTWADYWNSLTEDQRREELTMMDNYGAERIGELDDDWCGACRLDRPCRCDDQIADEEFRE